MFSIPPAIIISASPAWIACEANITDFRPEPHILFTVKHSTELGSPALIAACLAGACPCPADKTLPIITSCIAFGSIPVSSSIDFITIPPNSGAEIEDRLPRKEPIGVLLAETMTISFWLDIVLFDRIKIKWIHTGRSPQRVMRYMC